MSGDELAARLAAGEVALIDVRSADEYAGRDGYPCDPRQGHIPGAVHVELRELFAAPGVRLDAPAMRALLAERGIDPEREIVAYCHSGQRSALAAGALRAAGLAAANYEGSWHEWSRRD
jgi:thiosulfate/3-mercaptopyruvate sulfurtransferase